jgi:alpha-mannosidase
MIARISAPVVLLACAHAVLAIPVDVEIPASNITPTASSTFSAPQDVANLVNGSGLTGDLHDNDGGARTMWHTIENPAASAIAGMQSPAWVRFDFTAPRSIDRVLIWNHNQAGLTDRGFRKTKILGSADGSTWSLLAETELPRASGGSGTSTAVAVSGKAPLKAVIIAAQSNWGSVCYGLSEVKFITAKDVPEADLPFPDGLECVPQPAYRHRSDGQAGREVTVNFKGARLFAAAELELAAEDRSETVKVDAAPGGLSSATLLLPAGIGVSKDAQVVVNLKYGGKSLRQSVLVRAKRQWTVMLFPHSHVDIGYTNPQDVVEKIHMRNMDVGLELGQATAGYPEGARHVWNNEVLWAVESWLNKATPAQKQAFVEAVRKGQIGLSASYANLNTSAASDEELLHDFAYAKRLRELTGTPIDTMCQFDIPGMSWGIVQAAAQNGVRAILDFPNPSDRIGGIHVWRNRPFRWIAPDGRTKVLYLQVFPYNVAWKLGAFRMSPRPYEDVPGRDRVHFANSPFNGAGEFKFDDFVFRETAHLEEAGSPYDLYPCAWSLSDNAPVDVDLPDFVKAWNERYAYPRLVIASASTIADAFESRFGSLIPEVRGDLTEYWTDGLGTDARRVGYNRVAKETLIQSEILWSLLRRDEPPPAADFYAAWRWIQLGTEHTWGYMMPDWPIAKSIEATKASYFEKARETSGQLLAESVAPIVKPGSDTIAVLNTLSWDRTGLVTLPPGIRGLADEVGPIPVQKLASGETVFLATDVPALRSKLYRTDQSDPSDRSDLFVGPTALENAILKVTLDAQTGDITSLVDKRTGHDYVNRGSPYALNSFRYLHGGDAPAEASGPTEVKISIKEQGPLVASLLVESKAEGCNKLTREIRIVAGQPYVEILNTVDKISTRAKEGIHFGFAFNLPDGATARMDIPWGVMNPATDQLDGANKNWLACQRWIDVSGGDRGVTWVPIEAAIVEFGDITANLLGAVALNSWSKKLGDTRTVISWALNNHWHTNFPLEQGGVIPFRYAILPHGAYDPVVANRFGLEQNRPLLAVPAAKNPVEAPLVTADNPRVFVSTLKPAEDGKAIILRLRSLSDKAETVTLAFPAGAPKSVRLCAREEIPGAPVAGPVSLLPFGLATLRVELRPLPTLKESLMNGKAAP